MEIDEDYTHSGPFSQILSVPDDCANPLPLLLAVFLPSMPRKGEGVGKGEGEAPSHCGSPDQCRAEARRSKAASESVAVPDDRVPAPRQAVARLVSTVVSALVSHHDRADQATLGNDAVRRRRPEGRRRGCRPYPSPYPRPRPMTVTVAESVSESVTVSGSVAVAASETEAVPATAMLPRSSATATATGTDTGRRDVATSSIRATIPPA